MSARTMPGTTAPRNGMPPSGGYRYGGTGYDILTPHLADRRAPGRPRKDGRCPACGYKLDAQGHRIACGGTS